MNARSVLAVTLFVIALGVSPAAVGVAQRTFVASYGVDANPCSRTAPCRSFATAIAQTAADGEVVVLDSAGYGTATITQSVSIVAPDGIYAGISVFVGQNGITINGVGIKVVLRGLVINGQDGDDGVRIDNAAAVYVEKCVITHMGNDNADAGIRVNAAGAEVFVSDTTIGPAFGHGVVITADSSTTLSRVAIDYHLNAGVYAFATGGRLAVRDSTFAGNQLAAVNVQTNNVTQTFNADISHSLLWQNGAGLRVVLGSGAIGATMADNAVSANGTGMIVQTPTPTANAVIRGNVVTANGLGLVENLAGSFRTAHDNVVDGNGLPDQFTGTDATVK